jgi:hypothetical protein
MSAHLQSYQTIGVGQEGIKNHVIATFGKGATYSHFLELKNYFWCPMNPKSYQIFSKGKVTKNIIILPNFTKRNNWDPN